MAQTEKAIFQSLDSVLKVLKHFLKTPKTRWPSHNRNNPNPNPSICYLPLYNLAGSQGGCSLSQLWRNSPNKASAHPTANIQTQTGIPEKSLTTREIRPGTFLPWGDSVSNCNTVVPTTAQLQYRTPTTDITTTATAMVLTTAPPCWAPVPTRRCKWRKCCIRWFKQIYLHAVKNRKKKPNHMDLQNSRFWLELFCLKTTPFWGWTKIFHMLHKH